MESIKKLRKERGLTQRQVADMLGISLRSYISYENDSEKKDSFKYNYILDKLVSINPIDEEHGILKLDVIVQKCSDVFKDYPIHYCILFGSYAKGEAEETSDIDLLISSDIKGLKFYELVERLRNTLRKKIDVLNLEQLKNNLELTNEILQEGIKIYG